MKPIVVDSSVTVKWINQIDEKLLDQADELLADAQAGSVYQLPITFVPETAELANQTYKFIKMNYKLPRLEKPRFSYLKV